MKYLAGFLGFVAVLVFGIYVLAFTPFGNAIVAPMLESKIRQETKLESKLSAFRVNMRNFALVLELSPENIVEVNGDYSLFFKTFDATFKVKFGKLNDLQPLTQMQFEGTLFTQGSAKGDMDFIQINGTSELANSQTTYSMELDGLRLSAIMAKVKQADLPSLLVLSGKKPYASGKIDLDIELKNTLPHALDGTITLKTQNAKIDSKLMQSDLNVTMPEMAFDMDLHVRLDRERIDYVCALNSPLAKINSSGKVIPAPLWVDIKYDLDIEELGVLKPITHAAIRGPLKLEGTLKGAKEKMSVDGKSDICGSETTFAALLQDFEPMSLQAKMKNLQLEKVLHMFEQPHYADGIVSLNVDLSDARSESLKGKVITTVTNGLLDAAYLKKTFAFESEMPRTIFDVTSESIVNANNVESKLTCNTNLGTLALQKLRFKWSDASFSADYTLTTQNLDAFYFLTQRHMRGGVVANGIFSQAKDFDFSLHSNIAGGVVEAKIHNSTLKTELKSLQTLKLLNIFIYPEIFQASMNGVLNYDLFQKKGNLKATFLDGTFAQNQIFTLLQQYAELDMYEEKFKGELSATINKELVVASLELLSQKSSLKTQETKLNTKTKEIDASLDLVLNNNSISASIQGKTDAPKISVDLEKFMKSKAGDALKKEVDKFLKGLF